MSSKFWKIKEYYDNGLWGEAAVRKAVTKGWITQEECDIILGLAPMPTAPEGDGDD